MKIKKRASFKLNLSKYLNEMSLHLMKNKLRSGI